MVMLLLLQRSTVDTHNGTRKLSLRTKQVNGHQRISSDHGQRLIMGSRDR